MLVNSIKDFRSIRILLKNVGKSAQSFRLRFGGYFFPLFSTFLADAQRSIVLEILWTGDQIGLFLNGLGYRENFLTKVAQISNDLGSSFINCYNLN